MRRLCTRCRSRDYHHRARCGGRGNAMHRRNAPFPRYLVVVPRYARGSVNYAVFKYRFPAARFRGAQLIGLINDRSCQRPHRPLFATRAAFCPHFYHFTPVSVFREDRWTLDRPYFLRMSQQCCASDSKLWSRDASQSEKSDSDIETWYICLHVRYIHMHWNNTEETSMNVALPNDNFARPHSYVDR